MAQANFKIKEGIDIYEAGTSSFATISYTNSSTTINVSATTLTVNGNTVWSAGNDGAGSGLDADLWDGQQLPTLSSGLFLTNNGSTLSWSTVSSLPSQTGNNGKYLTTDGSTASWATVSSGSSGVTTATANTVAQRDSNADLYANNFVSSSDIKLKENICPIYDALATIEDLQGVSFNFIGNDQTTFGFIAQEVEEVLPEIVSESEDGTKSVNYLAVIAILVESIKELTARVNALEGK